MFPLTLQKTLSSTPNVWILSIFLSFLLWKPRWHGHFLLFPIIPILLARMEISLLSSSTFWSKMSVRKMKKLLSALLLAEKEIQQMYRIIIFLFLFKNYIFQWVKPIFSPIHYVLLPLQNERKIKPFWQIHKVKQNKFLHWQYHIYLILYSECFTSLSESGGNVSLLVLWNCGGHYAD